MFKNYSDYKQQRDEMLANASELLEGGKMDDYKAKYAEIEQLDTDFENFAKEQANINALKDKGAKVPEKIIDMKGNESMNKEIKDIKTVNADYYNAFYNFLRNAELTEAQATAFERVNGFSAVAKSTTTEAAAVPEQTLNEIWDLCKEQHSILGDIDMRNTGVAIAVVVRTEITKGKGKKVAENTANDSIEDTKIKVELTGNDFSATVELSYAAAKMSIPALENFLVRDIADQIGNAMAADVVETIEGGIASGNKVTTASATAITFAELTDLFSKLKRCNGRTAYVSNTTLYKYLVSMEDKNGRPLFQNNLQQGAQGSVLGATIKIEEAVADGKILLGDPKRVVGNVVQNIMVENDRDIKTHTVVYSAYARMQAALIDTESFAELTVKSGS